MQASDIHRETRKRVLEGLIEVRGLLACDAGDVEWNPVCELLRATADYVETQQRDARRALRIPEKAVRL